MSQSRYQVQAYESGSLLRIEPVKANRDDTLYECVAENGVGDAVSANAQLKVYDGKCSDDHHLCLILFLCAPQVLKI